MSQEVLRIDDLRLARLPLFILHSDQEAIKLLTRGLVLNSASFLVPMKPISDLGSVERLNEMAKQGWFSLLSEVGIFFSSVSWPDTQSEADSHVEAIDRVQT